MAEEPAGEEEAADAGGGAVVDEAGVIVPRAQAIEFLRGCWSGVTADSGRVKRSLLVDSVCVCVSCFV